MNQSGQLLVPSYSDAAFRKWVVFQNTTSLLVHVQILSKVKVYILSKQIWKT